MNYNNTLNDELMNRNLVNRKAAILLMLFLLTFLSACQHKTGKDSHLIGAKTAWKLNPEYSSISIITTKNSAISEVSNFTVFSGNISKDGRLSIKIDLKSLETNIPIRNQRIQDFLFQTDIYATADIHTQLKPEDLNVGVHTIKFDVDLHGVSAIMDAEFMVFEQYGNKVITLHKPLIINADTFGLIDGIKTLKNLAHLESINLSVPLNIILSFQSE